MQASSLALSQGQHAVLPGTSSPAGLAKVIANYSIWVLLQAKKSKIHGVIGLGNMRKYSEVEWAYSTSPTLGLAADSLCVGWLSPMCLILFICSLQHELALPNVIVFCLF